MSLQPNNPLHGLTLKTILEHLVNTLGWTVLAERIRIRCFAVDPSLESSLKFLRRTPWARNKVEALYLTEHGFEVPEPKMPQDKPLTPKKQSVKALDAKAVVAKATGAKRHSATTQKTLNNKPSGTLAFNKPKGTLAVNKPNGTLSLKKSASDSGKASNGTNADIWAQAKVKE